MAAAKLIPHLAQPFAAKRMLEPPVDARARWRPCTELRDWRNLMCTRLTLREYQTCIKHRIVSGINRYGLRAPDDAGDLFRGKGRVRLSIYKGRSPPHTQEGVIREWTWVDELESRSSIWRLT